MLKMVDVVLVPFPIGGREEPSKGNDVVFQLARMNDNRRLLASYIRDRAIVAPDPEGKTSG